MKFLLNLAIGMVLVVMASNAAHAQLFRSFGGGGCSGGSCGSPSSSMMGSPQAMPYQPSMPYQPVSAPRDYAPPAGFDQQDPGRFVVPPATSQGRVKPSQAEKPREALCAIENGRAVWKWGYMENGKVVSWNSEQPSPDVMVALKAKGTVIRTAPGEREWTTIAQTPPGKTYELTDKTTTIGLDRVKPPACPCGADCPCGGSCKCGAAKVASR